jgi:hypothetical protein
MAAPVRVGYAVKNPGASNTALTVDPSTFTGGAIATGDWMVAVFTSTTTTTTVTPPSFVGWSTLLSLTTVGSLRYAVFGKIRLSGDTTETFTVDAGGTTSALLIMWGTGSDVVSNWQIGANTNRSVDMHNTAASITTTTDHALVLGISVERTTANETAITSISGATEWLFMAQTGSQLETIDVGYIADQTPAGATGTITWIYPNTQATNGMAIQLAVTPPVGTLTGTATLTGTGTLTVVGAPGIIGSVSLSTEGTLTGVSGGFTGTAAFTATGALGHLPSVVQRPFVVGTPTVASNSSPVNAITLTKPSSGVVIQDGDLLVAALRSQSSGSTGDFTNAAWTRVGPPFEAGVVEGRITGFYVLPVPSAAALTATSWTWTFTGTNGRVLGTIFVVRNADLSIVPYWSDSYTGTTITNGKRVNPITIYEDNALLLLEAGTEVNAGPPSTPASVPSTPTLLENIYTDVSTAVSRTLLTVMWQNIDTGTTPNLDTTWSSLAGPAAEAIVLRGNAVWTQGFEGTASFTGSGTLAGSGTPGGAAYTGNAPLTATGVLSTTATSAINGSASLTAVGTLDIHARNAVDDWLASGTLYAAHRGGSSDWPEETLYAYTQAATWSSTVALEISVWKTTDNVWVCSHDQTTGRVFSGTSLDITTSTWSALSGKTTLVGGYPIARLTDILNVHATGSRVFFVDNKGQQTPSAFLDLLDTYGGRARFISKGFGTSVTMADAATARGYTTWGYYYDTDVPTNLANTQGHWTLLGMDFTATSGDWTAVKSYGKPVLAHIIATAANKATAAAFSPAGYMVSGVTEAVPQTPAPGTFSGTGTLAGNGVPGYSRSATLSGTGTLTATPAPGFIDSVALNADGTLVAVPHPGYVGLATLGTDGTLDSTNEKPGTSGLAALSGDGTVIGIGVITPKVTVNLSSTGTLAIDTTPAIPGTATLSATGALNGSATVEKAGTATLGTTGTLDTASTVSTSGTAALSTEGTLAPLGKPRFTDAVSLSADGTLTASSIVGVKGVAALTASGALASTGVPAITGASIALSATGALTGAGVPSKATAADFSAVGVMVAAGSPVVARSINLSAIGTLSASGIPFRTGAANFSAVGTLSLVGVLGYPGAADFSGAGVLTENSVPGFPGAAHLTGTGTLSLVGAPGKSGTADFSGTGVFIASTSPEFFGVMDLSGEGVLFGARRTDFDIVVEGQLLPRHSVGQLLTRRYTGTLIAREDA